MYLFFIGDSFRFVILRIPTWGCTERAKLRAFQTIKESSFTPLQGSVTMSVIILIVNMEADVSVVNVSLYIYLIFFMGEPKHSLEMLEEGSGITWVKPTNQPRHCTGDGQISSASIFIIADKTHIYINAHTYKSLNGCLYVHAMHLHLRCVERHIQRVWFP